MRYVYFSLILLCYLHPYAQEFEKTRRILILLDASTQMAAPYHDTTTNFKAASSLILQLMDSTYKRDHEVEFALRVTGHQYPALYKQCYDTKLEVMFSGNNYTQMMLRLGSLIPRGNNDMAFAIREGVTDDISNPEKYNYSILVITANANSCSGRVCDAIKKLNKPIPHTCIVDIANNELTKKEYSCAGEYIPMVNLNSTITALLNGCCNVKPKQYSTITSTNNAPPLPPIKKAEYAEKLPAVNNKQLPQFTVPVSVKSVPLPVNQLKKSKGYLVIKNAIDINQIKLFQITGTKYIPVETPKKDVNNRIILEEGIYKIGLSGADSSLKIKIIKGMITAIHL